MDSRINDQFTELPSVETPEDVAVLYSWANLHGAKYRDFSASRREYRAQLRHRAAEQARETELQAEADAASATERIADEARRAREVRVSSETESGLRKAQMEAAAQRAAAERAAAAMQREGVESSVSERRRAALYGEPDSRRRMPAVRAEEDEGLPGKMSDPYTPELRQAAAEREEAVEPAIELRPQRLRVERPGAGGAEPERPSAALRDAPPSRPEMAPLRESYAPRFPELPMMRPAERAVAGVVAPLPTASGTRRPQGYRPDDASGVRQIYRAPEEAARAGDGSAARRQEDRVLPGGREAAGRMLPGTGPRETGAPAREPRDIGRLWAGAAPSGSRPQTGTGGDRREQWQPPAAGARGGEPAPGAEEATPRRRRQDQAGYQMTDSDRAIAAYRLEQGRSGEISRATMRAGSQGFEETEQADVRAGQTAMPAWLHGQEAGPGRGERSAGDLRMTAGDEAEEPGAEAWGQAGAAGADTLQRSRERVASRWYALKGVFEQPGQERVEAQPVRQKETRTPVLAVFSFAGGVGKTSLVATLGRSLSSLGEKVLLTDTTSHGLLPFYFGASELREGTVRTFSPPSGSTDAPIYLVNYPADQSAADEAEQTRVVEEIANSSRGSHRVLLDLTSSTGWIIRRVAHMNPTVLVPLAPDMNSVISLQSIEKFLLGINGPDGTPVKVFYVLTQFAASQPLHLDVREVLRRQLGDRLLPMVIRRTPAVSEALAEGMTIVDYAADAPATEDYMNVAGWLRTVAAPATAGFRNVRWSER